jgi:signal transduction histidine kinase
MHRIRKIIVICCCLTSSGGTLFAQSRPSITDSLEAVLKTKQADSARVFTIIRLSRRYPPADSAKALGLLREGLRIAQKNKDDRLAAEVYSTLGAWHAVNNKVEEAEAYFITTRQLVEDDVSPAGRKLFARTRVHLANIMGERGNVTGQVTEYLAVVPILEELKDDSPLAMLYSNLATIFYNKQQTAKSAEYYRKAIGSYSKTTGNTEQLAGVYLDLASCMYKMDSLKEAGQYLEKVKSQLDLIRDTSKIWGKYYHKTGQLAVKRGAYADGMKEYNKALHIAYRFNDAYATCNVLYSMANLYESQKQYGKAKKLMEEHLRTASLINSSTASYTLYALDFLADLEFALHNPSQAYHYLRRYIALSDSVQAVEVTQQVHRLEQQFQSAQKEKKILALQHENERKTYALKENRLLNWLLAIGGAFVLLAAVLLNGFYRKNRKTMKLEMQKNMLSSMLKGEEQERTRLARDLHDGLGGLLSSIKIQLSGSQGVPPTVLPRIDDAVGELRRVAHSLMPEVLVRFGLEVAMKEYCRGFANTGVKVICQVFNYDNKMEQARQVALYRIMQELVNNALKHAQATQILVILEQNGQVIRFTVEDNGIGFKATSATEANGAGMTNLRARVDFLQGKLDIHSIPAVGTTVSLECSTQPV